MIRTNNGCQFRADAVRKYLASIGAKHEFTHVARPEENAYVESLSHAKERVEEYMEWYNIRKLHALLVYKTLMAVLNEAYSKLMMQNGSNLS